MSIARSESLKRELTDRFVIVQEGIPELRRFSGLTGQVKTVNMNGRALVQFDHPVDISWYDIDPGFLKVVDAPLPKAEKHAEKPAAEAKPAAAKPAPAPAAGGEKKLSPLELARQQGAAGTAAPKKLSPLELARQQGAAGKTPAAAAQTPPATAPAPVAQVEIPAPAAVETPSAPPAASTPSDSPAPAKPTSVAEMLAMARKQGAAKK